MLRNSMRISPVALVCSVIALFVTYYFTRDRLNDYFPAATSSISQTPSNLTRDEFVKVAFSTTFEALVDDAPLTALCAETDFVDNLVFVCVGINGGIGNLRNEILGCIRFAIEAGASGLVVPEFLQRNPDDLSDIQAGPYIGMETMFDRANFVDSMRTACPQITLYQKRDEVADLGRRVVTQHLRVPDLPHKTHHSNLQHEEGFRATFDQFRNQFLDYQKEDIVLIELDTTLTYFPVCRDSRDFVDSFGRILQLRDDVRRLAASVLYELSARFGLAIDPAQPLARAAYLGAHLRTDTDAARLGWTSFDEQTSHYLKLARARALRVVYVASGSAADAARFAAAAGPALNLTTKLDLLPPAELAYLRDELSWDQQALVDYVIMQKASFFAGMGFSSFAWNVGLRRRRWSDTETCSQDRNVLPALPWMTQFTDNLTDIIGSPLNAPGFVLGLWP